MNRNGFTLLELLIVIGILAVLATVSVLVINPAEYLRQSRDAKRIADMAALNKALGLAEFNGLNMGGASTTIYVSLVDTIDTCANLSLPSIPATHQYKCVTVEADLRKPDGSGWIPVNLGLVTGGSPLAALPVDPTNDATKFYTYIPGGSFALSATLESDKYTKQSGMTDGGTNPTKMEMGSDLKLLSSAEGLVGYWPFDEGTGTVANDMSGNNNVGTIINGSAWTTGKIGQALIFDGSNDHVAVGASQTLDITNAITIVAWTKSNNYLSPADQGIMDKQGSYRLMIGSGNYGFTVPASGDKWTSAIDNGWHQLVSTYSVGGGGKFYVDGVLKINFGSAGMIISNANPLRIGTAYDYGYFLGIIDDVRIYNRTLSTSEVKAMYDANK